jgi:hypothetical protein
MNQKGGEIKTGMAVTGCMYRIPVYTVLFLCVLLGPGSIDAQDLDPRAYVWIPIRVNTVVSGFAYSQGGVVTDPALPLTNLKADVQTPSFGYVRSFGLFGKTASAFVALPYTWAQLSADVNNQRQSRNLSGFSDLRMRMTVLLLGAPATTIANFAKAKHKTILGMSINVIAPSGQFFSDKLINLGTNRWSFRPELALSHPMCKRWLIDTYAGIWLFTNNNSFYPGNAVRSQNPMGTVQAHLSYNVRLRMWVALDATYYMGGQSSINDVTKDDRQSNSRVGATIVFPVGKIHSVKLAASTGAIIRSGADFNTFSIGWQTSWTGSRISH